MTRRRKRRPSPRGLTLIEVMISLAILSLAVVVIYGAMSTALISWKAGLVRGRSTQVARLALKHMAEQLKSAVPAWIEKDNRRLAAFQGGEDYFRFVTTVSLDPDIPLTQASYSMEEGEGGRRLVYREYPWPDKKFFEGSEPVREDALPEIVGMKVTLKARPEEDERESREEEPEPEPWLPEEGQELPGEVEIVLEIDGGEGEEFVYSTTVPLRSRQWR